MIPQIIQPVSGFLGKNLRFYMPGNSLPLPFLKKNKKKPSLKDGTLKDDYREAYHWLRDNTPEDTRVLAWWDYGYQLSVRFVIYLQQTESTKANRHKHDAVELVERLFPFVSRSADMLCDIACPCRVCADSSSCIDINDT